MSKYLSKEALESYINDCGKYRDGEELFGVEGWASFDKKTRHCIISQFIGERKSKDE